MSAYSDLSDEELIQRLRGSYAAVEVNDCFSTHDVVEMEACWRVLEERGYEIKEVKHLEIEKLVAEEVES